MNKDKLLPASIIFLGISLIISAMIISNGLEINGRFSGEGISIGLNNINNTIYDTINKIMNSDNSKEILTISEAADYLGISEDKLNKIINGSDGNKTGIPHTTIGNEYLFSRKALNEWVESSNEIR